MVEEKLGTAVDFTFDTWISDVVFRFNALTKVFYFYHKDKPTAILGTFKIHKGIFPKQDDLTDALLDAYNKACNRQLVVGTVFFAKADTLKDKIIDLQAYDEEGGSNVDV